MDLAEQELYLIGHAPQTVPDWFKPEIRKQPVFMAYPSNKFLDLSKYYNDEDGIFYEDAPEGIRKGIDDYIEKHNASVKDREDWDREYMVQRSVQWPIFWAKEVLKRYQDGH